ncbi:hypothetical protein [Mycobacterium sp.]|uniref:hypothetical protein n=1 Tax=Mycobacterium sp. TaxID=1785 RepID=UPI003F9497D2
MTDRDPRYDHQILVDFDGLLCDMSPFADELHTSERNRWARFFGHTVKASPIPEGVELVAALGRLGRRYSISTTRPRWVNDLLNARCPEAGRT